MGIKSYLTDPSDGRMVIVTGAGALAVGITPVLATEISPELLTARKYLSTFAVNAAGASNMNVNGAVTNVQFSVAADPMATVVVERLRILFESSTADVTTTETRRFGAATAANTPLTNGVLLTVVQGGVTSSVFATPVRVLGDFLNFFDDFVSLNDAVAAGVDYDRFDLQLPQPVFLPVGTLDKIVVTIRDDLTALTTFQLLATGYRETA